MAVALLALGSGFGQFGAVAALGDVARSIGRLGDGSTIAEQAGLSGTELGIGLAVYAWRRWVGCRSPGGPTGSAGDASCSARAGSA